MDKLAFIEEYKNCPNLWNPNSPNYNSSRSETLSQLAKKFNTQKVKIQNFIGYLRKHFKTEHKKIVNGIIEKSSWYLYDPLKFLLTEEENLDSEDDLFDDTYSTNKENLELVESSKDNFSFSGEMEKGHGKENTSSDAPNAQSFEPIQKQKSKNIESWTNKEFFDTMLPQVDLIPIELIIPYRIAIMEKTQSFVRGIDRRHAEEELLLKKPKKRLSDFSRRQEESDDDCIIVEEQGNSTQSGKRNKVKRFQVKQEVFKNLDEDGILKYLKKEQSTFYNCGAEGYNGNVIADRRQFYSTHPAVYPPNYTERTFQNRTFPNIENSYRQHPTSLMPLQSMTDNFQYGTPMFRSENHNSLNVGFRNANFYTNDRFDAPYAGPSGNVLEPAAPTIMNYQHQIAHNDSADNQLAASPNADEETRFKNEESIPSDKFSDN